MEIQNQGLEVGQVNFSIIKIFHSADFLTQIVMILLFIASIWSWYIFIFKMIKFKNITNKMLLFKKRFDYTKNIQNIYNNLQKTHDDPLSVIFSVAYQELNIQRSTSSKSEKLENIKKSSKIAYNNLIRELNEFIHIVGTIASISPFIGLLGTIFGIINSFESIASSKSANISIVAPGIAEALIITALGLMVAIPALIFFNYLTYLLDKIEDQSENFMEELNLLISKLI